MVTNIKLIKKEEIANGTMAFYFEKPKDFEYRAGQFADYTLIDPPQTDAEGDMRGFSFFTAPFEEYLGAATRLRDTAFKRVLKDLSVGTEVKLDGPYGDFTLHKNEQVPAVFLIGGIGVTPIRSIIAQATHDKTAHQLTLLHANRTLADAPFTEDFKKLADKNQNFTYVSVLTDEESQQPGIEYGGIDEAMLRHHVPDLHTPKYYLSGPEGMVKAMRQLLVSLSVDEDNIRTEEFSGY